MRLTRARTAAALLAALLAGRAGALAAHHERGFWLALRAQHFAVPAGESAPALALEAAALLGSTDSQLRDEVGYEALAAWLYGSDRLDGPARAQLFAVLAANARQGLGDPPGDGVFLRSFSTLALALFAAKDLKQPMLEEAQFAALLDLGVDALAKERDLRGYVPGKGWGHATAHAADLLKFLARSARLSASQQPRIVAAIRTRLLSAGQVFVWGEDARLAEALAALALRPDLDPAPFALWFEALPREYALVWSGPFDPARYIAARAALNTLDHLAADLDEEGTPAGAQPIRAKLRELRSATR